MYWNELKGLKIDGVAVAESGVTFLCAGKPLVFEAEGDCCSSSFIDLASVEGKEVLQGAHVLETDPTDSWADAKVSDAVDYDNDPLGKGGSECRQQYFYRLRTDKGWFSLTMYNDSNGYYGGSMESGADRDDYVNSDDAA